jgi:RNA polymerase sigma factor (sigma-70 family)
MILTYYPDFNTFYKKNRKEIEMYLWSVAWKYQHIVEPDDMVQDIMLRLLKSTFLKDWKKEKSALNTFLTTRIRGYALHVLTKKIREEPLSKYFVRLDKHHDYDDVTAENPGKGYFTELAADTVNEDEDLYIKEIKELFRKKVSSAQAKIYELHYWEGYTYYEIADIMTELEEIKFSYSHVRTKCHQATQSMLQILSKEGVHCGR